MKTIEETIEDLIGAVEVPLDELQNEALDLYGTPDRVARMLRDDLLSSYKPGAKDELIKKFTTFPSDGQDAMVVVGPVSFYSMCAHHLLSFSGEAYVGYIPQEKIIGLSKIPRAIDFFSRMFQIQERLGRQIADFIVEQAEPKWVGVLLVGKHLCLTCRGVRQENAEMVTTAIRPQPSSVNDENRGVINEFYAQIDFVKKKR